jgi:hypothetical protein
MERLGRFEEHRYVGDKRSQVVYDFDDPALPQELVDDLMASEQFASFGPDTLPEARNRGYRLWSGHERD